MQLYLQVRTFALVRTEELGPHGLVCDTARAPACRHMHCTACNVNTNHRIGIPRMLGFSIEYCFMTPVLPAALALAACTCALPASL